MRDLEGREPPADGPPRAAYCGGHAVIQAMGIELKAGRTFMSRHRHHWRPSPSSIPELARRSFTGENAHRARGVRTPMDQNRFREVIAVVAAGAGEAPGTRREPHL